MAQVKNRLTGLMVRRRRPEEKRRQEKRQEQWLMKHFLPDFFWKKICQHLI
jgi:hypothetical protein